MKLIFTLLACVVLTSCFNQSSNKVRIGLNQWPGYEPIYAAKIKNLRKAHENGWKGSWHERGKGTFDGVLKDS